MNFKAAISVYSFCYPQSEGLFPFMQIVAEKDERLAGTCLRAKSRSPWIELHVIPGAYHAFDVRGSSGREDLYGNYMQYDANATAKARELTKAFLKKYFGK